MSEKAEGINGNPDSGMRVHGIEITSDRPVLIAGPTASGKSALALEIAALTGGPVVNADALQVYADWRILTARPGPEDLSQAPHLLYGHVGFEQGYSVGDWLSDIRAIPLSPAPVIVGGTGLYFRALTEGLAEIPPIPAEIEAEARALPLRTLLAGLDAESAARIDRNNPRRVQRAWAVLRATGQGIAHWQDATPPPLMPLASVQALVLDAPPEWLNPRIATRFEAMMRAGALDEVRALLPRWNPALQSAQAIGAAELMAHVRGELPLDAAIALAITATRQYAKRQRTWFRARMQQWQVLAAPGPGATA